MKLDRKQEKLSCEELKKVTAFKTMSSIAEAVNWDNVRHQVRVLPGSHNSALFRLKSCYDFFSECFYKSAYIVRANIMAEISGYVRIVTEKTQMLR